jgi:hypothetical protein
MYLFVITDLASIESSKLPKKSLQEINLKEMC